MALFLPSEAVEAVLLLVSNSPVSGGLLGEALVKKKESNKRYGGCKREG